VRDTLESVPPGRDQQNRAYRGLTGLFDYHLDVVVGPPGSAPAEDDPNALDVLTVGLQKLGLKLEQAKGTAEIVVIDHVDRPSGN
jgi:uncharacterized protein (TIGR03435 family)